MAVKKEAWYLRLQPEVQAVFDRQQRRCPHVRDPEVDRFGHQCPLCMQAVAVEALEKWNDLLEGVRKLGGAG